MKIFAPINPQVQIDILSKYADEFYCGVVDDEWEKSYSPYIGYNTRGFSGGRANYPTWESLESAINTASQYNIPCFLTVNSHNITESQLPIIRRIISRFKKIGGSGIICSELNGLKISNEVGLKSYLSTNFTIYNRHAVSYLAKYYSFDRIILSRDVTLSDIKAIRKATNKEIEVFGQNMGCRFSNGLCLCTHYCKQGGVCNASILSKWNYHGRQTGSLSFGQEYDIRTNHFIYSEYLLRQACSLCAIYDFIDIGVNCIKIVGRELTTNQIEKSCTMMRNAITAAQESNSREEYWGKIRPLSSISPGQSCRWGLQCYYPEMANPMFINCN